jgi:sporulation protein YlmC with PRC-barrel domain
VAQHGQQQACEDILATTQAIYQQYSAQMLTRGVTMDGGPDWRLRQIATAQPVSSSNAPFRSDQLLDTDVSSPQGESLGSVHDIVTSPQTGKIAYLVIGRGGIFGIDEKFVPVPWADFKATPSVNLLVLNATRAVLKAAPQVTDDHFALKGGFDQESKLVDAYWNAQPQSKLSDAGTVSP